MCKSCLNGWGGRWRFLEFTRTKTVHMCSKITVQCFEEPLNSKHPPAA